MKFIKQVPPLTRYMVGGTFLISLLCTYKILNPYHVVLVYEDVFKRLQLWRLITTFLFAGTFGPSFLFAILMLYFTCQQVDEYFKTKPAELLTLLFFNALCVMIFSALYGNSIVLHGSFVFSLIYTMCKLTPDMMMSIWGFPV
jgi:Derlin-2/3